MGETLLLPYQREGHNCFPTQGRDLTVSFIKSRDLIISIPKNEIEFHSKDWLFPLLQGETWLFLDSVRDQVFYTRVRYLIFSLIKGNFPIVSLMKRRDLIIFLISERPDCFYARVGNLMFSLMKETDLTVSIPDCFPNQWVKSTGNFSVLLY